jgi:hypothetical protein
MVIGTLMPNINKRIVEREREERKEKEERRRRVGEERGGRERECRRVDRASAPKGVIQERRKEEEARSGIN